MSSVKKVLIIGGGIGGATLAAGLAQAGVATRVIDSGKRSDRLGTGICLLGNALRALDALGLAQVCIDSGFGYDSISNFDAAGNLIHRMEAPRSFRSDAPGTIGIMRPVLADILEAAALGGGARIDYETTAKGFAQDSDGVTVTLSTGEIVHADLLVAADGAYSETRAAVFGAEHKPVYAGQGCWRYTVPRPASMTGLEFYRAGPREVLGGIPLSDSLCYYFLLENSEEHPRMDRASLGTLLRERLEPFTAPVIRAAADLIDGPKNISFRPFDIMLMPQPWVRGRIVLIGDAAHALTPQLTSGGGMAIEDAVVLAQLLATGDDVDATLSHFSAMRGERVKTIYENSLQICRWEQDPVAGRDNSMGLLMESHSFLAGPFLPDQIAPVAKAAAAR